MPRALVISDTHFGAWTGRDILKEEFALERLAPQLEDVDELIFLGDLFDFLFGTVDEAVAAAEPLLALIAEKLAGKRLVFLAGNHDHHLVHRDEEDRLEARLAHGDAPGEITEPPPPPVGPRFFRSYLERKLPGIEVEIAYPTYEFEGVLCTHGHYLDPHARLSGSRGDRLLTHTLWAIASGGPEEPKCIEDYESVMTLLTEWLYIAAQMPHGTHAQQNVFRAVQRTSRFASALGAPVRGMKRVEARLRDLGGAPTEGNEGLPSEAHFDAEIRDEAARQARERPVAGSAWSLPLYPEPTVISRSDPSEQALEAFAQVVENLDWAPASKQVVFAHTHQPLADVRSQSHAPGVRYWNTGSWIYEPDLGSRQGYGRYLRYAWPGTAVLIDSAAPQPRLVEMLADLNPLRGGAGLPPAP